MRSMIRRAVVATAATATVVLASAGTAQARPSIDQGSYVGPTIWGSIWGTVRWLFPF